MKRFIHLALFWRRLADPDLTAAQRKIILRLLTDEQAKTSRTTPSAEEVER